MSNHQFRVLKSLKVVLLMTLATLPFQNCGGGFEVSQEAVLNSQLNTPNGAQGDSSDTTAPVVAILAPRANALTRGAVAVSGSCEAGLNVLLTVNGASSQQGVCNGGNFSFNLNLSQADGAVTLSASQTDVAGNAGNSQVSITKDSVAPVVQVSAPTQNAQLTSQALVVSGACESGHMVNFAGTLLSAPAQVQCLNMSFQANVSTVSTNGSYSLSVSQTDAAGNQSTVTRTISLNIPAGAPSIKISSPAANSATRTGITVSGTCTSGLPVTVGGLGVAQSSQVSCNSGSFSSAITFSSGDGTKNIIVSQTNAQNVSGQDSRSFLLDTTVPAIAIVAPAAGSQADTAVTISGSCETGLSISISGAGVATSTTTPCAATSQANVGTFQSSVSFSSGVGSKVVTVSQTDGVGNIGTHSRTFQRIAPVLDGGVLYANNCSSCHGALASSTKVNRTAQQITSAMSSIPQMSALTLSSAQVDAIAAALNRSTTTPMACNDTSKLLAPQLKRLTVPQFANSVRNAFGNIFQDTQFPNLSDANPRIGLGSDPDHLKIDEVNINALYNSVNSLVATIRSQNSTVSTCVTGTSTTCFDTLISTFGQRLWRRPLTSADTANIATGMTAIVSAGATRQQRVEYILKVLLMAPEHLYRSEIGASATPATAIFSLTQYEIASLLAFTVWDSPPDDTLLDAARTNSLSTKAQLKSQLSRMVANPLFAKKMANFSVDILKIEDIKTVIKDASFGMTDAERMALYNSARTTLEEQYASSSADFMAPYTGVRFHSNNLTARYFGISANGLNANFTAFNADASQRYGMLSHPAFLTSIAGQVSSGIVRRGVYALEQLLCNHLGAPPTNVMGVTQLPAGWDPTKVSSRVELQVSHSNQAACMGCHQKIDPAGFGFENYNSFGQFRLFEKGSIAIDSSGSIAGVASQTLNFNNSVEYIQAISQSPTFRQCMQKRFFKYASGETAETVSGQCEYSNFEYQISQKGGSIQALLESYVELESFAKRNPASQ